MAALCDEERRLKELAAQSAAAAAPVPAASAPDATAVDPNTALIQALTQAILAQQESKAPPMPVWNGESTTKRFFLEEIQTFKKNKYFSKVVDWSKANHAHQDHSLHLRRELLCTIPVEYRPTYTKEPCFHDGFVFLDHFLKSISRDGPIQHLMHLVNFATYQVGNKSRAEILSDSRHIHLGLRLMTMDNLLSMRLIQSFKEEGCYEGIVASFTAGDKDVVGCNLNTLSALMEREDALTDFVNPQGQLPAAKRGAAKQSDKDLKPPVMQVSYPLTSGIQWKALRDLVSAKQQCPFCFSRISFHTEEGCPALAQLNLVLVEDEDKAKAIQDLYTKHKSEKKQGGRGGDSRGGNSGGQAVGRGRGGGRGGRGQGSTHRATSGEQTQPADDAADPSHNKYAALADDARTTYVDNEEVESDYSDGADIDVDFSSADQSNPKSQSSNYPHSAKACEAKANNVSKVLSSIATTSLSKHQDSISKPLPNTQQCCADSGATDHMFPDYHAFTSYKRTPNCFIQLGDGTRLQQYGLMEKLFYSTTCCTPQHSRRTAILSTATQ